MLKLSLKQLLVAVVLIAALLVVLLAGILRGEMARVALATPHGGHTVAWYCPAPPVIC
jgi:hypothetical protein